MKPVLNVRYDRDDDDLGKLYLSFRSDNCSGQGSCWTGLYRMEEEAKAFTRCPLDPKNLPVITIGCGALNSDEIREVIHMSALPLDGRGTIGLRLRVTYEERPEAGTEAHYHASVLLRVTYQELERLGKSLIALAKGNIDRFELEFEPQ